MAQFCNQKWDMVSQAYVTLLSSLNYLEGVLVLHESLRAVNSRHPLLVLITEEIATKEILAIFEEEGIFYEIVEALSYCESTIDKHRSTAVLNTASKLHLFTLVNWDKLVYIDADAMVLENVDDLFLRLDGSMVKYSDDPHGFTGMFVIEPPNHDEGEFYIELLKHVQCFDGDLIGKLWFFIRTNSEYWIPPHYFAMPTTYTNQSKVIHYCNPGKPWMQENCNDGSFLGWKYNIHLQNILPFLLPSRRTLRSFQ